MGNELNAATRYGVWWATLAVVTFLPLFYVPMHPKPALTQSRAKASALPPGSRPASADAGTILDSPAKPPQTALTPIAIPQTEWPQRLAQLWGVSVFFMLCRLSLSLVLLQIQRGKATDAPDSLTAVMKACLVRCGVKRRARVAVVSKGGSPLVTGPIRPCILIPAHLLHTVDNAEMEQICLHEAAHLARFDDFALLLQRMVEAVAVFHPAIRWIARQIDLEREIACDDYVIAVTGDTRSYASCLTRVAELANGYPASPVAAAAAHESSHLNRRIEMLLNKTRHTGTRILKGHLAAGCVALVLITWLAGKSPAFLAFAAPVQAVISKPAPQSAPKVQASALQARAIQAAPRGTPTPSPTAQAVRVLVSVTDPLNRYVTGLDQSSFRIYEDGMEQTISSLQGPDGDFSLTVVSNGEGNLKGVEQAIAENERKLAELRTTYKDSYPAIVILRERILQLNSEKSRLSSMISLAGVPAPPLLNSIRAAAANYDPAKRQAILVIFDPRDKSIFWPESELHAVIRDSHLPIYSIAVHSEGEVQDSTFLNILTDATGGRRFVAASWDGIPEIENKIKIELQNQYALTYTPRNTTPPGAYRQLEVRVIPTRGLPPLHTYTRPGYYTTSP